MTHIRFPSRPAIKIGASLATFGGLLSLVYPSFGDQKSDLLAREGEQILKAHCFPCHSAAKSEGGLRLDKREFILKGGVSGPSLIAGKTDDSPLMERVLGHGGKPRMPIGFAPLPDSKIQKLREWANAGAPWSTGSNPEKHWAYKNPVMPAIPPVKNKTWVRNPVDAFVLAKLEKEGLSPSPEADRFTLIRRITFDLTGLPPTPKEVDAFVDDKSPNAFEKLVDRLMASPHYGERMALPWLDAARYADSNGFQQDGDNYQYVWRDWVVRALNSNMPFDQFTIEQLAGDLLPEPTLDQKIATGFNRCHLLNGEGGAIPEEQRNVVVFDRVEVTSTTWLGVTMMCAQCHDHKYDPLSAKDYYGMFAFFNNVPESGVPPGGGQYRIADPWIDASTPEQRARLKELEDRNSAAQADVAKLEQDPAENPKGKEPGAKLKAARAVKQKMQSELDAFRPEIPRVMVMSDARPRETHLLLRGNYQSPGEVVASATPAVFPPMSSDLPKNRLGLAKWLLSKDHPLTARVQVNRLWQVFFGNGFVKTPENFGVQAESPSHPELLDWLAVRFRNDWNIKAMVRLIVTSATYRQASRITPTLKVRDPENRLLARGARFRLPAMFLRDTALAASGLLNDKIGGKPVYPYQPADIWDALAITKERDFTYPQSKGADLYRRSLYTFWRRTVAPGNMFDASVRNTCKVKPSLTSTPLHALTTLNDVTWVEAARAMAEKVMKESPDTTHRIQDAFRRVCARKPDSNDLAVLRRAFERSLSAFRAHPADAASFLKAGDSPRDSTLDPVEHAAYASLCLAIFNLDEALTRE